MRFHINSPFWRFIDTCTRFSVLNLLFLATLIPVVTIGPARAALYGTLFAYSDHEDISLGKEYLKRFRNEFIPSIGPSVIIVTAAALVVFALAFWNALDSDTAYIVLPVLLIVGVIVMLTFETYYPLQARYRNTFMGTLRNSLMLPWFSFGHALILLAIDVTAVAVFIYAPWLRFLFSLLGCAWIAYAKSLVYLRLFAQIDESRQTQQTKQPVRTTV